MTAAINKSNLANLNTQVETKGPSEKNLLVEDVEGIAADEVVDIIAESVPGINIAYKLVRAYMGRSMKLRQHRVLEWVEFVRDNLGAFSKNLFDNEQFQDCFVLLTEAYIRERAQHKRTLHQQILLNLANLNNQDREKFELERILLVTSQISLDALKVLAFVKNELLKNIEKDIQDQLKAFKDRDGVEGIRLEAVTRSRIIISDYISKWIYEHYNVNSEKLKSKYHYTNSPQPDLWKKLSYEEYLKEKELLGPLPELENLGILIRKDGAPAWGGTVGSGYSLSDFGYKYLAYLDEKNE